jgi:hypothetical protein
MFSPSLTTALAIFALICVVAVPLVLLAGVYARPGSRKRFLPVLDGRPGPPPLAGERRAEIRRRGNPVQVQVNVGQEVHPGWVVERSADGVRLQLPCEAEPGALLALRLGKTAVRSPCLVARVLHCRQVDPSHWALGCAFLATPNPSELQVLG